MLHPRAVPQTAPKNPSGDHAASTWHIHFGSRGGLALHGRTRWAMASPKEHRTICGVYGAQGGPQTVHAMGPCKKGNTNLLDWLPTALCPPVCAPFFRNNLLACESEPYGSHFS